MAYKITEETIEQEVAESLKAGLGADVLSQVRIAGTNKKPDLIVSVGPWEILIEGKIGSARDLTGRAILQVSEYKEKAGAHGFMVLIYPPLVRQYVRSGEDVREIVQTVPFYLYCLTPFLKEGISGGNSQLGIHGRLPDNGRINREGRVTLEGVNRSVLQVRGRD